MEFLNLTPACVDPNMRHVSVETVEALQDLLRHIREDVGDPQRVKAYADLAEKLLRGTHKDFANA